MIDLIETPQRADIKAKYTVEDDVLTVKINGVAETIDFTGLEDGMAEEITVEYLPVNPIVSVEKTGDVISVTVIRFYGEDEKAVFENGENQMEN